MRLIPPGFVVLLMVTVNSAWAQAPSGSVNNQAGEQVSLIVPEVLGEITAQELGGHLRFIASDLMRGRDTASPEIQIVAEYLAGHMAGFGALPGGDRKADGSGASYFARFPLTRSNTSAEGTTLEILSDGEAGEPLPVNDAFFVNPSGIAGGTYEGEVVFVGAGGAEQFAEIDAAGQVVLISLPFEGDASSFLRNVFQDTRALRDRAAEAGAEAILLIVDRSAEDAPAFGDLLSRFLPRQFGPSGLAYGSPRADDRSSTLPVLYLDGPARKAMIAALGQADLKLGPVEGLSARFTLNKSVEELFDNNVIGYFEGTDPELKNEVIIYSAHYDHIGTRGDRIWNGADDNGSGTSALLEIAEAFGEGPKPKRSVAFLWVSGEEKGLWGSRYFAENPTLPEGLKIVANINMDMVSRNDPDAISLTPSPNHPNFTSLTLDTVAACEAEGIEVVYNADQFFFRTDSANFARIGVPVIFLFAGTHEDYHQPSDTIEKVDITKAAKIARASYRLGWKVANAESVPGPVAKGDDE